MKHYYRKRNLYDEDVREAVLLRGIEVVWTSEGFRIWKDRTVSTISHEAWGRLHDCEIRYDEEPSKTAERAGFESWVWYALYGHGQELSNGEIRELKRLPEDRETRAQETEEMQIEIDELKKKCEGLEIADDMNRETIIRATEEGVRLRKDVEYYKNLSADRLDHILSIEQSTAELVKSSVRGEKEFKFVRASRLKVYCDGE